MSDPGSQHAAILHSLALVHRALRRSLDTIIRVSAGANPEAERAGFSEFTERFARFLQVHHDGEEEIIFPALRAAAQRAAMPDQVVQVATWQADHVKLLGHLSDLETACASFRKGGSQEPVAKAAAEVRTLLFPHLDAEETMLTEAVLQKLMTGEQVESLSQAASRHGQQHGGGTVMMMYLHGLTDEEQIHFSTLPWFVRRVLMRRVWARGFRSCLKYAHNPSIAL